jgi:hypothetical protein
VSIKDSLHRFHGMPSDRSDLRDRAIRQRQPSYGCPPQVVEMKVSKAGFVECLAP